MKDNIVLIGFMGCGKTSVGIRLSYALKQTMIDTDKWIERKQKMTIPEIFDSEGEEAFREMEKQCLIQLAETENDKIISTGGGLPIREENHSLLKELGRVYYLKVSPQKVYERLKNDTTRPLLQTENPQERIKELLTYRAPFYEKCADYIIEVSDLSFDEIIAKIIEKEQEVQ